MANETPAREQDKFMLRLPDGMRDRIAELARANNRSMNAEIVARLQRSIELSGLVHPTEVESLPVVVRDELWLKTQEIAEELDLIRKKIKETFSYEGIKPENESDLLENISQSLGRGRALRFGDEKKKK